MSVWNCPICGEMMQQQDRSLRCLKGHSFDMARSGYVNLLPANKKHAKNPGDNSLMVHARREFLEAGYYAPLREKLQEVMCRYGKQHGVLLDCGCGEGYYTQGVADALQQQDTPMEIYGIDIAKVAVDAAAKRLKTGHFSVGSVYHLPVSDHCCDSMMSIFAPYCGTEFQRVLKKDGVMILVIPAKKHLWGLKSAIYEHPYPNEVKDYALEGFSLLQVDYVHEMIQLNTAEDIQNLFRMTPYYYKTGREEHARLEELTELETEISFEILQYKIKED